MAHIIGHDMPHVTRYLLLALAGVAVGALGMALGAFLASASSGWGKVLYYSAVGVVCAPLAAVSWATRKVRRRHLFAGTALAGGLLTSLAILFDLTTPQPPIIRAAVHTPFAFSGWFLLWALWIGVALCRLIMFEPPHTHHRLSSRRGDGGA